MQLQVVWTAAGSWGQWPCRPSTSFFSLPPASLDKGDPRVQGLLPGQEQGGGVSDLQGDNLDVAGENIVKCTVDEQPDLHLQAVLIWKGQ